ncbi:MAG TPA: aldehyde dehydrogenase family protein [Actinomycetota bacterium]|nr:aldehyde dehydrogenase family protein [Actinomycetota bacterium]
MSVTERGRVLLRASALLRERLEEFAVVESRNAGKPINAARGEIGTVANVLEYWAAPRTRSSGNDPVSDRGLDVTLREPGDGDPRGRNLYTEVKNVFFADT